MATGPDATPIEAWQCVVDLVGVDFAVIFSEMVERVVIPPAFGWGRIVPALRQEAMPPSLPATAVRPLWTISPTPVSSNLQLPVFPPFQC